MEMTLSAAVRSGAAVRAGKRLLATPVVCPASGKVYELGYIIADLRQLYRWSAARIAKWLEDIGL